MAEIGAIGKDQTNKQQGFKYRGIDDVMNALQPVLVKYGVFVVPEVMEQSREERQTKTGSNLIYSVCTIRYTFCASDGSNVSAVVIGEGMDSGDKATNKAMAIAFKYACFQVFCIPTEEMKDPDSETLQESTRIKTEGIINCEVCKGPILAHVHEGKKISIATILAGGAKYNKKLCYTCLEKEAKNA
jgi:hypothetical protein